MTDGKYYYKSVLTDAITSKDEGTFACYANFGEGVVKSDNIAVAVDRDAGGSE